MEPWVKQLTTLSQSYFQRDNDHCLWLSTEFHVKKSKCENYGVGPQKQEKLNFPVEGSMHLLGKGSWCGNWGRTYFIPWMYRIILFCPSGLFLCFPLSAEMISLLVFVLLQGRKAYPSRTWCWAETMRLEHASPSRLDRFLHTALERHIVETSSLC